MQATALVADDQAGTQQQRRRQAAVAQRIVGPEAFAIGTAPGDQGVVELHAQQQFGVTAADILKREAPYGYSERFTALMRFQAERAHACFDEALALLPEADRRAQKPGLMMANIYRALLREVEATGFQVLHQRIALTPLRKLWIAMVTNWKGR